MRAKRLLACMQIESNHIDDFQTLSARLYRPIPHKTIAETSLIALGNAELYTDPVVKNTVKKPSCR